MISLSRIFSGATIHPILKEGTIVFEKDPRSRLDNKHIDQNKKNSIIVSDPEEDDVYVVTSNYNLEGTVIIDLYDNDLLIGSIWLFDSNSIEDSLKFAIKSATYLISSGSYPKQL